MVCGQMVFSDMRQVISGLQCLGCVAAYGMGAAVTYCVALVPHYR